MHQFVVSSDGTVHEVSARAAAARLKRFFPGIDPAALEAHLMLERTHRILANLRESHWGSLGLTGSRLILLRLLYTSDGKRLSMSEIASQMNLGMNNVTQLVGGLVRDGLVEKANADDDKRVVYALITAKGEDLFASVFPDNSQRIKSAWSPLSEDEKQTMIDLLSRLRVHLLGDEARVDFAVEGPARRTRRALTARSSR